MCRPISRLVLQWRGQESADRRGSGTVTPSDHCAKVPRHDREALFHVARAGPLALYVETR